MNTFEHIYNEQYRPMFRVAKKMVNCNQIASDIVQDVFISLYQKLNNGDIIRQPAAWLYRATYNKCIDHFRVQSSFSDNSILENCYANDDFQSDKSEMIYTVNNVLSKMNPSEKLLTILYSEGLSYKEIAEVTGIKQTSVGKTLARTLQKFEQKFKSQYYELH